MKKLQLFDQKHGLTPLQKCQFCAFLQAMFLLFRKACLLYKTSKTAFSGFIFAIYDMGIQGVTRGNKGLQGVTRCYKGLQGVTRGYNGWQGVTWGNRGLQRIIETFFVTRTFRDTFSWFILRKNQSWRNLKFLTKTMD